MGENSGFIPLTFDADGRLTPESKTAAIDALFTGASGDRAKRALTDLVRAVLTAPSQREVEAA